MVQMDYSTYLDEQNCWANSLIDQARTATGARARELAELAGAVFRRTLAISELQHEINRRLACLESLSPKSQ